MKPIALIACAMLLPAVALGDQAHPPRFATNPAPTNPAPTNPAPTKPAPTKPAPTKPAPKKPGLQAIPAAKVWHTATPGTSAPLDEKGHAKLVLQGLNIPDHIELTAATERGGFGAEDLDHAAHVMREPASGNEHPIDPRLLDFVYRVQTHFQAHEVRIISGYRTPTHGGTSNHGRGRAMDLVVPGASDEEVAKFAREQGFCGVGTYPVSGFVHLDVRPRSYFWVDSSGPRQKSRVRGILPDVAAKSDGDARKRGDAVIAPFAVGGDVDAACPSAIGNPDADDDDTDASL